MTVMFDVRCEGRTHSIVVTDEGDFVPLDHEEIEEEMAAGAMGAKRGRCIVGMMYWQRDPVRAMCVFDFFDDEEKGRFLLECVEHVEHYYSEQIFGQSHVTELLSATRSNLSRRPLGAPAQKRMVRLFDAARNDTLQLLREAEYQNMGIISFVEAVLALADFAFRLFPGNPVGRGARCFEVAEKCRLVALWHRLVARYGSLTYALMQKAEDESAFQGEIAFQRELLLEYIQRHEVV
jgi:hypothetical protein